MFEAIVRVITENELYEIYVNLPVQTTNYKLDVKSFMKKTIGRYSFLHIGVSVPRPSRSAGQVLPKKRLRCSDPPLPRRSGIKYTV